jgi:peptidoglycan/LPS O-acetylase OafA/YrhL
VGTLRVVLALSVVLWHIPNSPLHLLNASVAVVCFFMISGFYMAMVINEKYATDDGSWIGLFYRARFWRLYPTYFAMLAIMVIWFALTNSPNPFTTRLAMPFLEQVLLVFANLAIIGQDFHQTVVQALAQHSGLSLAIPLQRLLGDDFFQNSAMMVGQAWSLSSEFLFYAIAPFIVRSKAKVFIALAGALVFRVALIAGLGLRSGIWGYWFFPGVLCMFLMGAAAYHFRQMLPQSPIYKSAGYLCLATAFAWAISNILRHAIILPSDAAGSIDSVRFWIFYVAFAASIPAIFEATRDFKLDRTIGELSYPLYLVHGLVCGLIFYRWSAPRGFISEALAAVVLSCMCAWALYAAVEAPVERFRSKFIARANKRRAHVRSPTPITVEAFD